MRPDKSFPVSVKRWLKSMSVTCSLLFLNFTNWLILFCFKALKYEVAVFVPLFLILRVLKYDSFADIVSAPSARLSIQCVFIGLLVGSFIKQLLTDCLKKPFLPKLIHRLKVQHRKMAHTHKALKFDLYILFAKMCSFNPSAAQSQKNVLGEFYTEESFLWNEGGYEYSASEEAMAIAYLKKENVKLKLNIVKVLLNLAIIDDGIKNDEWNFLIDLLHRLGFRRYVDEFKERNEGLRTESDYNYHEASSSSSSSLSVEQLSAYFAELGLPVTASKVQAREAYHQLAMQHHPDLPKNSLRQEECEAIMEKINEAYSRIKG